MINVRQAMAAAWRQPVPDHLWDYLVEKGYVGEVEEGRMPVGDLIGEAQQIRAAAPLIDLSSGPHKHRSQ